MVKEQSWILSSKTSYIPATQQARSERQPCFDPIFDHTNQPTNAWVNLIDEIKELADVIGDGGDVRVGPLQVLLVYLANALHALIHLPSICNNQDTIGHDIWS